MNVKTVQEWLVLAGYKITIDGEFGPATKRALSLFQTKNNLPNSQLIDEATSIALISPMTRAMTLLTDSSELTINDLIISYVAQHIKEHPLEVGGENMGPWVRLYTCGHEGTQWAWCAGFASTILKLAYKTKNLELPFTLSLSCDELAANAKKVGRLHSEIGLLKKGDLFLVRRPSGSGWHHTGVITETLLDVMHTGEGNTNDEGSREGYEACYRIRNYDGKDFITCG